MWLFWKAGFYPTNQSNFKGFQKVLIGWNKAVLHKIRICFGHIMYTKYFQRVKINVMFTDDYKIAKIRNLFLTLLSVLISFIAFVILFVKNW